MTAPSAYAEGENAWTYGIFDQMWQTTVFQSRVLDIKKGVCDIGISSSFVSW